MDSQTCYTKKLKFQKEGFEMKKTSIFLAVIASAAVLTLTACDEKATSTVGNADGAPAQTQSADSAQESTNEKPPVLKEGTLIHVLGMNMGYEYEEQYDENGKMLLYHEAEHQKKIVYEYDANGNLVKETKDWFDDCVYKTVTDYDANGNATHVLQTLLSSDNQYHTEFEHTYTYECDEAGNPILCKDEDNRKVWEREYVNGVLKKQTDYAFASRGIYVSKETEYDDNGNKVMYTKYDEKNELVIHEEYDSNGNMTKQSGRVYGNKDQGEIAFEYDNNGNMMKRSDLTSGDSWTFEYDAEGNELCMTTHRADGYEESNNPRRYEYKYDEFGNKIEQTCFSSDTMLSHYTYEYVYKD